MDYDCIIQHASDFCLALKLVATKGEYEKSQKTKGRMAEGQQWIEIERL